MNIYKTTLQKGDIISDKDHIDILEYTGWNNGKIWKFFQCDIDEHEILTTDISDIRYLTAIELNHYKKW